VISRVSMIALTLVIVAGCRHVASQGTWGSNGFDLVDSSGNIRKPSGYRDHYQALGAYTVLKPNGNEVHAVYASPGTAECYRKAGKFADGTVLVKEVFGTDHAQLTTGDAHWASKTKVWFVLIKDQKGRYPGNPLWGDGWDGLSSSPTSPTSTWRSTTGKTASGATSRQRRPTGSMSRAIPFSPQSKADVLAWVIEHLLEEMP